MSFQKNYGLDCEKYNCGHTYDKCCCAQNNHTERDCCGYHNNCCGSQNKCCCTKCCGCKCCCKCIPGPRGPQGEPGPQGPQGPQGETGPFLSNYLEALGTTQTVADGDNFVFVDVDCVGTGIELDPLGTTFTITRTGLYHIEWSMNLAESNQCTAHIGLLQNGIPTSFSASSATTGNFSSGALINVTTTPYTITLNNRSADAISIEDQVVNQSALSIRILRFADGATV